MSKLKVFLAGEVFKIREHIKVVELFMQTIFNYWLGKDTVKVELKQLSKKDIEITIFRKYEKFYSPSCIKLDRSSFRSIFEFDKQIILETNYQIGGKADLTIHEGRFINFYDLDNFFKEYRKHTREKKATSPKEILFEDDFEYMKLTLKYYG